jgi:uncharacterized lipoprotein YddW (UPF0748 family)
MVKKSELLRIIGALILLMCSMPVCSLVTSNPGDVANTVTVEERGVWLNRTEMFVSREKLLKFLDDLKEAHFTSVYVDVYFQGSVIYPDSRYLPESPKVSEPDILTWLLPEIKKRGMRAEAWVEYGFYAFHTPDAGKTTDRGVFLNKYPELTAIADDGVTYLHNKEWGDFFSLCPANPKSHELLINVFTELLERYPFDGINLDRIRFPNEHFCYCNYCKAHFKSDTGIELKPYKEGTPEYRQWAEWRKEQLNRFMKSASAKFRSIRPGLTVSLSSIPPESIDSMGQGWDNWLREGYIDAAMPMLYGDSNFNQRIMKLKTFPYWSEKIFPGLDAAGLKPEVILEQIKFAKSQGAKGIVFWYSGKLEDDLPGLKSGPFAQPAVSPLGKK